MATAKDKDEAERGVKRDRLQARLEAIVASLAAAYRGEPRSAPMRAETVAAEIEADRPSTWLIAEGSATEGPRADHYPRGVARPLAGGCGRPA